MFRPALVAGAWALSGKQRSYLWHFDPSGRFQTDYPGIPREMCSWRAIRDGALGLCLLVSDADGNEIVALKSVWPGTERLKGYLGSQHVELEARGAARIDTPTPARIRAPSTGWWASLWSFLRGTEATRSDRT